MTDQDIETFDECVADLHKREVKGLQCGQCGRRAFHLKDCPALAAEEEKAE